MRQYHLDLDESDVGRYVLMPGDPHRVSTIAAYLSDAREMSFHREFCTWTGYLGQTRVSVVSSGIGGPSTAIALEELAALGVHTVIRTGTCGLLQPSDTRGTLVIATGCYRGGSTANAYVPLNYPAIADFELVEALCTAARSRGVSPRVGYRKQRCFFSRIAPIFALRRRSDDALGYHAARRNIGNRNGERYDFRHRSASKNARRFGLIRARFASRRRRYEPHVE